MVVTALANTNKPLDSCVLEQEDQDNLTFM